MKYPIRLALFLLLVSATSIVSFGQTATDRALQRVTEQDRAARQPDGRLPVLHASEHLSRADVYSFNRMFESAREHWLLFLENYPKDPSVPKAFVGIGRTYMWELQYDKAIEWFDKLMPDHVNTREARDGLAWKGASLIRIGKSLEGARVYAQYVSLYPQGERIVSAHLNIIDGFREAGRFREANDWVSRTRNRFSGAAAEIDALQAKLRMELFRGLWNEAVKTADEMLALGRFSGTMARRDEIQYLRAYSLDKAGRVEEAIAAYDEIPKSITSYYGGLALDALQRLDPVRVRLTASVTPALYDEYPVRYRELLLDAARRYNLDARLLLAIMKQESGFNPNAKSPAAARGLLQLVFDTAVKYNVAAGFPDLKPDDLYDPRTNIEIGSAYIAALKGMFSGLDEAVAASYNAGEDNAARWLARTNPKDSGLFAAEVGFSETKNYVYKVMGNYRAYRTLYKEDLARQ